MTKDTVALAVVVKGWPRLSETFVAQELVALEKSGIAFELWSLRHPTDAKTHPLHDRLRAKVRYLPEYLHQEPLRVARAVLFAAGRKGFLTALRWFLADLRRDRTRNRVRRFGQACVMAHEMPNSICAFYAHFLHTPSSVTRYAAILSNRPWSFSAHAKDIWTSPEWELREKLSDKSFGASFGATCTDFGAEHLRALSDRRDRVDLVYHGLDLDRFPEPPQRTTRSKSSPLRLMSVGRLVEKKGFDRLIDALALLPEHLDWHWTHIGGGGLSKTLHAQAENNGTNEKITWLGACDQPQVIDAMRQSDLFVLPSRIAEDGDRDGLPNVLMEAASQKLPILSTPVSAIPEFIVSGEHGILASDAPDALSNAIADFANDPDLGPRLANAAYVRLINEFQMDPGIAHLARRLNRLIAEGCP